MKSLRHILRTVVASLTLLLGACNIYDNYPIDRDPMIDPRSATLVLHVGIASQTRALASNETMHSLRIVLLDQNNKVEYNDFINDTSRNDLFENNGETVDYSLYNLIKVVPGAKKIFLIANEESVTGINGGSQTLTNLFDGFNVGDDGFENAVNALYFTPDFTKNLVLSAYYEFEVASGAEKVSKEFWLVHAAAKFEFQFINNRISDVEILDLKVNSVADDMYLMPNLDEKEKEKDLPDGGGKVYWIDWLKAVCDATNANPDLPENKDVNEKYGWIYNYDLPTSATHSQLDIKEKVGSNVSWVIPGTGSGSNNIVKMPEVYCSESKNPGTDGLHQQYSIDITVKDEGEDAGNNTHQFTKTLENQITLFRNTHAKVTITMSQDGDLELLIGICPWYSEDITIPTFD